MPTRRRPKGQGSVWQRARDGKWCASLEVPGRTASGGRRRITLTADTKKGAERRLRDKRRELEDGGAAVAGRATVERWAATWLDITATQLRPASWQANRSLLRRHVLPAIGRRKLGDLTPADVRLVATRMAEAGLRDSSARRAHRVLISMLRAAVVEGHHVPGRVFMVEAPASTPSDVGAISTGDALELLRVASRMPDGSRWAAALLQGLRQGEALGLTWDRVDLEVGQLELSWQLQPLPYRDRVAETFRVPRGYEARRLEGAYHLVRPKSRAGHRVVPIVPWLADALARWRDAQPASPHGLVWPRMDGRPRSAKYDLEEWHAVQAAAGVAHPSGRRYGTHEARHTTATLLMELRVDPAVVTAILGHSSIVVSRGYMHASQDHARAALEAVAGRLTLPPGAAESSSQDSAHTP